MPTPTRAKPPVPAWIIRERKRLGLKPRELAERLTAMGLTVTEGTVRTWEAGRNPHPDNIEGLERIFGSVSPGQATGDSDLADAIRQQAVAIQALADAQMSPVDLAQMIGEAIRLAVREALQAAGLGVGTPQP